mgnify:FL=1
MSILTLLLALVVIGIVISLIEMDASIRRLIVVIVAIVALVILFRALGILPEIGSLRLR